MGESINLNSAKNGTSPQNSKIQRTEKHKGFDISIHEARTNRLSPSIVNSVKIGIDQIEKFNPEIAESVKDIPIHVVTELSALNSDKIDELVMMMQYTQNLGNYNAFRKQVTIKNDLVQNAAPKLEWTNEEMTKSLTRHELGHAFDHTLNSKREDALYKSFQKKLVKYNKHTKKADNKNHLAKFHKERASKLFDKIGTIQGKLANIQLYNDTEEFTEAYKKDLEKIAAMKKADEPNNTEGKLSDFTQLLMKNKEFLKGVTFEDGIDDMDIFNSGAARDEVFAESFNVNVAGDKYESYYPLFDKLFANSMKATKNIMEKYRK